MADVFPGNSEPRLSDPLPHPGPERSISGTPEGSHDHATVDLFKRDRGAVGNLMEALYSENPYRLNFFAIFGVGALATLVFTMCWYPIYFSYGNASTDFCLLLGSIFVPNAVDPALVGTPAGESAGWVARILGIGIHIGVGIGIAFAYATILLVIRQQSKAGKGALFGVMIGLAMMAFALPFFIGLLARFHPLHIAFDTPDVALNQIGTGNLGWGPMLVALIAHAMYGYILGSFYRHKVVLDTVSDPHGFEGFNPAAGGVAHGH